MTAGEADRDRGALHRPETDRATWSGSSGLTGLWRVVEPLLAAEVKAGESAELRRLRAKLEPAPVTVGTLNGAPDRP